MSKEQVFSRRNFILNTGKAGLGLVLATLPCHRWPLPLMVPITILVGSSHRWATPTKRWNRL